jgi:hypothetical protein
MAWLCGVLVLIPIFILSLAKSNHLDSYSQHLGTAFDLLKNRANEMPGTNDSIVHVLAILMDLSFVSGKRR